MEYNGVEIPDEKIIDRAKELGLIEMPTEEWLYHTLQFLETDCIGTRYLWPTARHLYARLSGGEQHETPDEEFIRKAAELGFVQIPTVEIID